MNRNKWALFKENGKWVIRRWQDGKNLRLSIRQYQHIREDDAEIKAFVHRLNAPILCQEAVTWKHAFISPALCDEYRELVLAQVPSTKNATCQYNYLIKYFLNYFIGELNLVDPKQWYAVHKTKWANFLLNKENALSASTMRKIIQEANRFMEFLADKRPNETAAIRFKPISRAKFRVLSATEKMKNSRRRYVTDKDWVEITKRLPSGIRSVVTLCYLYGLRRSEALGLRLEDVRKEFLSVERQNLKIGAPSALKGRKARRSPHWYAKPAETYKLIANITPMSPDSVADEWAKLKTGFNLHDLRATFISRALRDKSAREVQLAVGHQNLATTMLYAQDHRDLQDDIWTPDAA